MLRTHWLDDLRQDLVFALRQIQRSPTLTLVVTLTLALGIAASTVVFSVVSAVVLAPLPYPEADRLVRLWETTPQGEQFSTSDPNFIDFREQHRSFTDLAAVAFPFPELTLVGEGEPERFAGMACTGSLFTVLGVPPMLGRTFSSEEDAPGSQARVFVLSHGLWQRRFAADPEIVGKTFNLSGESWTAIGVMPPGFRFLLERDLWVPYALDPAFPRGDHRLEMFGRLRPGVSLDQARADMSAVADRLGQTYPDTNRDWGVLILSFPEWIIGPQARRATLVLQIAVGLMLLLACANVSNLLIAHATARQREIGLRAALGAGRWRIIRQLITEAILLGLLGGTVGVWLAYWAIPLIRTWNPDALPRIDEIAINPDVLLFAVLVSVAAGVVSGLAPAIQITTADPYEPLRESHPAATGGAHRLRDALVIAELAVAVTLLIGAGLLVRSFRQLTEVDVGFSSENVHLFSFTLPENKYPQMSGVAGVFYREVLERVEAVPGVSSAGVTIVNPFQGPRPANQVAPEGVQEISDFVPVQWRTVTPGFFRSLNIPLLRGRLFDETDRRELDPEKPEAVAIISTSLAARLWPNEDPLEKRLQWNTPGGLIATVIGVVGDIRDLTIEADPPPMFYFYHEQIPWPHMTLVVRSTIDPAAVSSQVRQAVWEVNKDLPVPTLSPLENNLSEAVAGPRFNTQLLSLFGLIALVVAAMGIYGVISYSVTRRRREIGVRLALGGRPRLMVTLILRHAAIIVAAGMSLGVVGAVGFTRLLRSLLFETSPTHPATFVTVALGLAAVALMASFIPAIRASKVDPAQALRTE